MNDRPDTMLIFADADPSMGIGHVARCASLGAAWQAVGGLTVGIGHLPKSMHDSNFGRRLQQSGIQWEKTERTNDVEIDRLAALKCRFMPQWVVFDGYHFSEKLVATACQTFDRVAIIDDSFARAGAKPDTLLIPSPDAVTSYHPLDETTLGLFGPRFMPLANDYRFEVSAAKTRSDHDIPHVIVLTGGSDPARLTETILDAAERIDMPLVLQIVVGPANPRLEDIRRRLESAKNESQYPPVRIELVCDPTQPADVMRNADLAISAAGGTCWELASLRIPMLLVTTAENQRPNARWLDEQDAAVYLGDLANLSADSIASSIQSRLEILSAGKEKSPAAIDGRGADRTVAILRELIDSSHSDPGRYRVRPLRVDDSPVLWRLANSPSILRWSTHRNPITPKNHRSWFFSRLEDPENCRVWMLDLADLPIGSIRYQRRMKHVGPEAVISFQIASPLRGRGLGTSLMESTLAAAASTLNVERMTAFVYRDNVASARCFEKLGFTLVEPRCTRQKFCFELLAENALAMQSNVATD